MDGDDSSRTARGHRSTKSDTTHLASFPRPKMHTLTVNGATTPNTRHHQLNQLKEHEASTGFFDLAEIPQSASAATFESSNTMGNALSLNRVPSNTESLPSRRTSPKLRVHTKLPCPEAVEMISAEAAGDLLKLQSNTTTTGALILDTRPFHDYCKSHIIGAINLSLPSTLSRRPTFTLEKCIQTLTTEERLIIQSYISTPIENQSSILIYDNIPSTQSDVSPAIFHLAKKFINSGMCKTPIHILENGYQTFEYTFNDLITTGSYVSQSSSKSAQSDGDTSYSSINDTFSPDSIQTHSPQSLTSNGSVGLATVSTSNNTVIGRTTKSPMTLSRFTLPDVSHLPVFKARHNEELMNDRADSTLHLQSTLSPTTMDILPEWLNDIYGTDLGATELSKKFNSLQMQERERLNSALTRGKARNSSPKVSSGFELGRKNRYKDILPYEHSRVKIKPYKHKNPAATKLPPINTMKLQDQITDEQSYINASYLHFPSSKFHYIATQGPLAETVGDFWNVVYDHKVPIVLSLTPEIENYVEKCAPFWVPGNYISNGVDISVELVEELTDATISPHTVPGYVCSNHSSTTFRHFKIQVGSSPPLHTLQIHVTTWPDHGVLVNPESLIGLVSLKTYIMDKLITHCNVEKARPVVVHCSAGSGRTGCFCCIDTAIDQILTKENNDDDDIEIINDPVTPACEFVSKPRDNDLIYNITSSFRTQRVAVVQNLRQYILIYDTLLYFIEIKRRANELSLLSPSGTLGHFLNGDKFTGRGLVDWEYKLNDKGNHEGQFINNFLRKWY